MHPAADNTAPAALRLPSTSRHPELPVARIRYRITLVGWWWIGITLLFLGIGYGKGVNLLLLLSYSLLVMFVLNLLGAGGQLGQLRARRCLPDLVFARSSCSVHVDVW